MDLQFFGRIHIIFIILVHLVLILQTTSLEDRQHSSLKERRSGLKDRRSNLENLKSDRQRILDELTELEGHYKSRVACTRHALKAQKWMGETDQQLGEKLHDLTLLSWNYITNMNEDTLKKLEEYQNSLDDWMYVELQNARMYLLEEEQVRKCNRTTWRLLNLFINFPNVPLADDPETRKQINHLGNKMDELTATAKVDRDGKVYRLEPELNDILSNSRDYDELLWAWEAWHNSSRVIKPVYIEFIDKVNEAARDNRFDNLGISWQLTDFQETDVESMMDDLLEELRPFYEQLHSFVRQRLILAYPDQKIDPQGPIPVHLLGNMFAQEWTNIIDLLMPYPDVPSIDVTKALKEQNYTPLKMFKLAEEFFTSIGLEPMTSDFWDKSIIVRPAGNISIECHASAEDFLSETDFRIKMCTSVIDNDLWTVHHEMGHIEYFMQYRHQAALFRTGANAAFHEAIGDTIALSAMTTKHLKTIGLSSRVRRQRRSQNTEYKQKINFLMAMALTKVAFIPFGYVVDKWRYQVFRGDITPDQYNTKWWELRERYQGVVPPVPRPATEFDPGAKHHIPANVPYSRYFFSFFGQFQFQSALCKAAQHNGSLSDCDIYRSTEAGSLLKSVLELGASKPWPDVMQKFTGQRKFKADALLDYFAPLREWLENENKGQHVGWTTDDV